MMMLSAAGCYYGSGMGYGSYANANKIKTTAAADTLEEFKITDFQASDGTFQYKDLGWLSSYQDLEKEIAMPIGTTTSITLLSFLIIFPLVCSLYIMQRVV